MKRIFALILVVTLVLGCKETPKTSYTINGNAEGVYNGVRVYLKTVDYKTAKERNLDTAIVMNGKFSFKGSLEYPELRFIRVNNVDGRLPILVENNDISISINKDNIIASTITGSESHKAFKSYETEFIALQDKATEFIPVYRKIMASPNQSQRDSISQVLRDKKKTVSQFPIEYIKRNKSNYLSLIILEQEVDKKVNSIEVCKEIYEALSNELKKSPKGKKLGVKINGLHQIYSRQAHLEIGKIAPNFEAPTPDGKMLSLDQIKGKVTIVDFWAAWCGPCRRENPNVVNIYNKYHKDGLEIIGVSLDGQSRQQDPKKAWIEAIKKDGLTWHQVSNLNYFNDPVAKLYNIRSIPATFIFDAEGKIVAKNLRGKALENKVKELLEKS